MRGQQGGTAERGNPRGPVTKFEDTRAPKTKFVEARWVRGGVRDIRAFAEKSAICLDIKDPETPMGCSKTLA